MDFDNGLRLISLFEQNLNNLIGFETGKSGKNEKFRYENEFCVEENIKVSVNFILIIKVEIVCLM